MITVKKINSNILLCVLCVFFIVTAVYSTFIDISYNDLAIATSTYYDYKAWSLWTVRDKITTYASKVATVKGKASTVLRAENKVNKQQKFGYEYTKATSGAIALGATIPLKAIELEVGGKVKYAETRKVFAHITVPAKRTYTIKKRTDTRTTKFTSKVQRQEKSISTGKWRNDPTSSTKYSAWKEKYPTIYNM